MDGNMFHDNSFMSEIKDVNWWVVATNREFIADFGYRFRIESIMLHLASDAIQWLSR